MITKDCRPMSDDPPTSPRDRGFPAQAGLWLGILLTLVMLVVCYVLPMSEWVIRRHNSPVSIDMPALIWPYVALAYEAWTRFVHAMPFPESVMAFGVLLQFPVYGVLIDGAARNGRKRQRAAIAYLFIAHMTAIVVFWGITYFRSGR